MLPTNLWKPSSIDGFLQGKTFFLYDDHHGGGVEGGPVVIVLVPVTEGLEF